MLNYERDHNSEKLLGFFIFIIFLGLVPIRFELLITLTLTGLTTIFTGVITFAYSKI
jgi:hypothetical protein